MVVAPLERNDVPLDGTAKQIYLQDTTHHIYTTPGKFDNMMFEFYVTFMSSHFATLCPIIFIYTEQQ